jgi:3-hydroxyacyl-CoA dehydrogenase / enoyl-CoA hydratase / 3-hydroxybutyryl-CoA epimerase
LVCEGVPGAKVDREAVRFGMPMGPLELLDQVGIDVAADVAISLGKLSGESGPTPERLATMARAGWTGKKAGKGFYEYHGDRKGNPTHWATMGNGTRVKSESEGASELTVIQQRLIFPMVNEAAKCLESGVVADAWMVDLAMVLGTGFAPFRGGPLRTADALGVERVVHEMDELRNQHGVRFDTCSLLRSLGTEGRGFYSERVKPVEQLEVLR